MTNEQRLRDCLIELFHLVMREYPHLAYAPEMKPLRLLCWKLTLRNAVATNNKHLTKASK